jgi:hypothetical protein
MVGRHEVARYARHILELNDVPLLLEIVEVAVHARMHIGTGGVFAVEWSIWYMATSRLNQ